MLKTLCLILALAASPIKPVEPDYPRNLPEPHFQAGDTSEGLKYWVVLEPKCLIETIYDAEGSIITEITFLEPYRTKGSEVQALIETMEDLQSADDAMTFAGSDKDGCTMYTTTNKGHILEWVRNVESGEILKIRILYTRQKLTT